jgi:5-methylcytosine-specific restriction endonuclease McrA
MRRSLSADEELRRRSAYEATHSDEEAAALVGMNLLTYKGWRTSRGLAIKNPKPGPGTTPEELDTVRDMLGENVSFETIAAYINEHKIGNRKWLKTPGSVAWNALRLGIITREDLERWYEERKRDKMATRAAGRHAFRSAVLGRDGNRCVVCGSRVQLEVDHIVELWIGGPSEPSNGVTLCRTCHKLKTSPKRDPSWHRFADRYAAAGRKLGFNVETGWCTEHNHHYLVARKATLSDSPPALARVQLRERNEQA